MYTKLHFSVFPKGVWDVKWPACRPTNLKLFYLYWYESIKHSQIKKKKFLSVASFVPKIIYCLTNHKYDLVTLSTVLEKVQVECLSGLHARPPLLHFLLLGNHPPAYEKCISNQVFIPCGLRKGRNKTHAHIKYLLEWLWIENIWFIIKIKNCNLVLSYPWMRGSHNSETFSFFLKWLIHFVCWNPYHWVWWHLSVIPVLKSLSRRRENSKPAWAVSWDPVSKQTNNKFKGFAF